MTVRITTPAAGGRGPASRVAALLGVLSALAAVGAAPVAAAQQVVNPGDIIVERDVTPRSAFASVPKSQDPVSVRATTFPKNSFDPMMASLVSDTDLTNARGSTGVAPGGVLNSSAGMQAVTRILSGGPTGANTARGPTGAGVANGIGGTISTTVTGALAPLSTALGGALGGLK